MKDVDFRGIRFRVPDDWGESDHTNAISFTPPGARSLRLHVSLRTVHSSSEVSDEMVRHLLLNSPRRPRRSIEMTAHGQAMCAFVDRSAKKEIVYWWEIGQAVPPSRVQIGLFALTLDASDEESQRELIATIDAEIRNAKVEGRVDITPSSKAKTRWWQIW